MKNNYFTFLFLLLSATSLAQIYQLPQSLGKPIKPIPIFGKPAVPTSGEECFCFEFHTDPNAWLNAYDALINSQYEQFFAFQRDAIEEEIEQRLNEDFPNYEQSVKELFRNEAAYDFENDYINDLRAPLPAMIETLSAQGQLIKDKRRLFQFVYGQNNHYDFAGLRHNTVLLENMPPEDAFQLYDQVYYPEEFNLINQAFSLQKRYTTLGSINNNNILADYLANQMWLHHRSYPDYQEIQQISAYLIYYANSNQPGPYITTPGLFDGLDYYSYNEFYFLSDNIIDQMVQDNYTGEGPSYTNKQIDDLMYIYSTEQENIGLATYDFLQENTNLIPASANYLSSSAYSSFSISNVIDVISNFQSGERLLPWAHTYGENVSGQSLDRPDRIFYMQWDNDGLSAGYNTISHLLEGLSNIPGNYNDGNFIVNIFEQNIPGFTFNSEINYGLLFDFDYTAGGISIEFSPYALEHIIGDLEHFDGEYGWDLFIDTFKIEALIALSGGGQVYFNENIIKDPSFVGTQIDCVLNALINSQNNIWKQVTEAFTPNDSEYRLKFTTYNNPNDLANARTALPDANGIIEIRFNLGNISSGSLEIANDILHEAFHAELHRIHFSNNEPPNSLPADQFAWFEQLWDYYTNDNENYTAANSEHFFMAQYLIDPIAIGLREFDSFAQSLDSYKFLAWSGLDSFGLSANYITQNELDNLAVQYQNVFNDNNEPPCN